MRYLKISLSFAFISVLQGIPFPNPSYKSNWKVIKAQAGNESEVLFTHGLNVLPYKVVVEVMVNINGTDYMFHGIGSAHIDDDRPFVYGGVIYRYGETTVECLVPNGSNNFDSGVTLYTGENGWSGPSYITRSFQQALIRVKVWAPQDFVSPDYMQDWTSLSVSDSICFKEVFHTLGDVPDFVVVQIRDVNTNFTSEAQGSTSVVNARTHLHFGGVVYGFSNESFRLWYPCLTSAYVTPVLAGIMSFADGWGMGKTGRVETGKFRILAWKMIENVCLESRISESKEALVIAADQTDSYVTVEVEAVDGANDGFRFYGMGSTMNDGKAGEFGGLIYAYSEQKVLYWVPATNSLGHVINIGGIWGSQINSQASDNVKLRVKVFNMPSEVICREIEPYTLNINELILDKKSTSAYKRSKISVYERSTRVVAMGSLGLTLIVSTLLILTVPGIPTMYAHIKIGYRNLRQFDRVKFFHIFK